MTQTKHTPAPWHVGGKDEQIIYGEDGWAIADAKVYHGKDGHNSRANARLIAAAPELLAALESIIKAKDEGMILLDTGKSIKAAREAIAKAKGE